MKTKYMTLDEIRNDLDKGIEIFWANDSYKVHYVDVFENINPYSVKNNKAIRITCISNYFGSLIDEKEIKCCYSKRGYNDIP